MGKKDKKEGFIEEIYNTICSQRDELIEKRQYEQAVGANRVLCKTLCREYYATDGVYGDKVDKRLGRLSELIRLVLEKETEIKSSVGKR